MSETPKSLGKCPICSKPTVAEFRPSCSRRCADVDLSRWLGGVYAIPVTDADDDEDGDGGEATAQERGGGRGGGRSDH